jgi:antitoxin (DNA-binding transcriptional repressor) of toxin-antitoxin stability system
MSDDREIGVEAARKRLGPLVDDAAVDGTVTYLTRRGRRFAAIVPLDRVKETTGAGQSGDDAGPAVEKLGDVDRDELFEAVEDLVMAVDVTTAAGSRMPGPLAEAIDEPTSRLAEAWDQASGDGPLDELVDAARAVVAAARPHAAIWPPALTAAAAAVETALT